MVNKRNPKKFLLGVMLTYDTKMKRIDTRLPYQQRVKNEKRISSVIANKQDTIDSLYKVTCNTLPDMNKTIINMRCNEGKTLRECGELVGVTPERIRQIEKRGYELLQEHISLFAHILWPNDKSLTVEDVAEIAEYQPTGTFTDYDIKLLNIGEYYGR